MKTKFYLQPLLLASLALSFISTPAFADDSSGQGFGHQVSGFFHHLFSHFSQPSPPSNANASASDGEENEDQTQNPIVSATPTPAPPLMHAPIILPIPPLRDPTPTATPTPTTTATPSPTPASIDACAEMAPGDSRIVNLNTIPKEAQQSGVIPEFLLKRVSDNADGTAAYEAVLNIHFLPKAGENLDTDAMTKFTQNCYAALPPIVNADGKTLKIRMADADEAAPIRNINLTGQHMDREDMVDWSTQSNCRVIVHESLHLLGLVDLYQEPLLKTASGGSAYDCRKLGPNDSVMRDYIHAHFSTALYVSNSCSCEHNDCLKEISAITETPSACPALADSSSFLLDISQYDIATDPGTAQLFDLNYKPYLQTGKLSDWVYTYYNLQPDHHAFLYPAEFRMITAPGCHAQNAVYYQCASAAYRSSSSASGCGDTLPAVCSDPNQWLQ